MIFKTKDIKMKNYLDNIGLKFIIIEHRMKPTQSIIPE